MPTSKTKKTAPPAHNVRHDLDPTQVQVQIAEKIAKHESDRIRWKSEAQALLAAYTEAVSKGKASRWTKVPEGDGYIDPMVDEWLAYERDHYARVRVVELPKSGKRFVLVYGDADDTTVTRGTGPFESLDAAAGWFMRGGR